MMSRITLALKRHLADLAASHLPDRTSKPLEWGAVTRPPRIALTRGRVQYVERAPGDTGILAVVSRVAHSDDVKTKAVSGGYEGDRDVIEMDDMEDLDLTARKPRPPV